MTKLLIRKKRETFDKRDNLEKSPAPETFLTWDQSYTGGARYRAPRETSNKSERGRGGDEAPRSSSDNSGSNSNCDSVGVAEILISGILLTTKAFKFPRHREWELSQYQEEKKKKILMVCRILGRGKVKSKTQGKKKHRHPASLVMR